MLKSPKPLGVLAVALSVALSLTPGLQAQSGSVSGLVIDGSGAAVPGAELTLKNETTDIEMRTRSNAEGLYIFPFVDPAVYTLRAQADGFQAYVQTGIIIETVQRASIDVRLEVGDVAETVTVKASPLLINKSDGTVGSVVDRQFVENLPLNGRSFQQLIAINPGVVQTPATSSSPGQFSVNGQRTNSNYFTVDGVSANFAASATRDVGHASAGTLPALSAQGGTNALVSVDAMHEFNVKTSTYAPEFGRSPGAQVAIATRSGTNDFHGTVFEYFRNDVLDANDWFANRDGLERPPLRQNDFGGVLGGPIVENATFFFVSHESLRLRQPRFGTEVTPLPEVRENAAPGVRGLMNAYPVPNQETIDENLGRFAATFSNPSSLDATSVRIDTLPFDWMTLFGRYNYSPSNSNDRGRTGLALSVVDSSSVDLHTFTAGSTQIFSPALTNEVRFNYSRNRTQGVSLPDDFGGAVVPDVGAWLPEFTTTEESTFGVGVLGGSLWAVGVSGDSRQEQFHLVDNLSWVSGSHQIKLGMDFRRMRPSLGLPRITMAPGFLGWTGPGGMADGFAPFVAADQRDPIGIRIDNWSLYVQDEWRVSSRATLTYGVRWDYNPSPVGRDGQELYAFRNLENPNEAFLSEPGVDLYDASLTNFAPRVGLAYRLGSRRGFETVLRGGYGLFYDMGLGVIGDSVMLGAPYYRRTRQQGPFPAVVEGFTGLPFTTEPPFHRADTLDPEVVLPRTHQWNVTIEQALGASRSLEVGYVAAAGRKLSRTEQFNLEPEAAIRFLTVGRTDANSDYHSLQATFRQRLTRGLQGMASYTWSHSIDSVSTDTVFTPPSEVVEPDVNRGASAFDIRHMFNGALTYELPEPSFGGWRKQLARGWGFDAVLRIQTAFPVDLFQTRLIGTEMVSARPDLVPGQPLELKGDQYPGGRIFNRAAFASPEEPRQGSLGRNVLRGFGLDQVDLAIRRRFALSERVGLQFRGELFNAFNSPSFADPSGDLMAPLFGQSTQMFGRGLGGGGSSGGLNPLYQVGGPRSIQLALKLTF